MNFDKMEMVYKLPHGEPYVIMPIGFVPWDDKEQSKVDKNMAKYHDEILRLKENGYVINAADAGDEMLKCAWMETYKLVLEKLLVDGERRTLCLYNAKDGIKKVDMYESVWWLDKFMHQLLYDGDVGIYRKECT